MSDKKIATAAKKTIGEKIKTVRKKKKLTQTQLAERMDAPTSQIGDWERGAKTPGLRSLIKIADALGCPVVKLIE